MNFAKKMGTPVEYPFVKGFEDYPEIIEVKKLEHEKINFGGVWHSDTTYLDCPPMGSMLLSKEIPPYGGDTLFAMGCGRLFEGDAAMMWASLSKLMKLPDDTKIWCGHEYTQSNGRFALSIEPGNQALKARMDEVNAQRAVGKPTVPATLGLEKQTNPFLRPDSAEIRKSLGMENQDTVAVFHEIRERKNNF